MKKIAKKLTLARETVLCLSEERDLKQIAGASDSRYDNCTASRDEFCERLFTRATC